MNATPKIFLMLLASTLVFHSALNYMEANIEDFETVPLPPKIIEKINTLNPVIQVNAKIRDSWMLVNFSTGEMQSVPDADSETQFNKFDWDLGFSRTKIISNGGATNPLGKTGVINLGPLDFDRVSSAPKNGYIEDKVTFGNLINKEFSNWYNYRTRTHNIESKKNVYVLKLSNNSFVKMRILNYYCGQKDQECRSMLCTREQAACLTLEYVLADKGTSHFSINHADSRIARNIVPTGNNN